MVRADPKALKINKVHIKIYRRNGLLIFNKLYGDGSIKSVFFESSSFFVINMNVYIIIIIKGVLNVLLHL